MPNYKQNSVSGDSWTRCPYIEISNRFESLPVITFREEVILQVPGVPVTTTGTNREIRKNFDADEGIIDILDLDTNIPTGETVSHLKLYQILYSLYLASAIEADNAVPAI